MIVQNRLGNSKFSCVFLPLRLTDDAVKNLPQRREALQDEDVGLATLLGGQSVELIFLHIVSNAENIDV